MSLTNVLPPAGRKVLAYTGLILWLTLYGTWEDTPPAGAPGPTPDNSQPTPTKE